MILGQGAFGRVMKAEAIGIGGSQDVVTVAVKMVKGWFSLSGRFMSSGIWHCNVIVSGVCHLSVKLFYVTGNELWLSDCVW